MKQTYAHQKRAEALAAKVRTAYEVMQQARGPALDKATARWIKANATLEAHIAKLD